MEGFGYGRVGGGRLHPGQDPRRRLDQLAETSGTANDACLELSRLWMVGREPRQCRHPPLGQFRPLQMHDRTVAWPPHMSGSFLWITRPSPKNTGRSGAHFSSTLATALCRDMPAKNLPVEVPVQTQPVISQICSGWLADLDHPANLALAKRFKLTPCSAA